MTKPPHTVSAPPVRTCIGCRQRAPATELCRLRLAGQVIVATASAPGRGASLHARAACVERAVQTGALARAFKRPVAAIAAVTPVELFRMLVAAGPNEPLGTS